MWESPAVHCNWLQLTELCCVCIHSWPRSQPTHCICQLVHGPHGKDDTHHQRKRSSTNREVYISLSKYFHLVLQLSWKGLPLIRCQSQTYEIVGSKQAQTHLSLWNETLRCSRGAEWCRRIGAVPSEVIHLNHPKSMILQFYEILHD